jgi:hypothetical protein
MILNRLHFITLYSKRQSLNDLFLINVLKENKLQFHHGH